MENPEDALVRAMLSSDPEEAAHAFEKAAEIVQQQHQQLTRMLADAFGRLEKLYPDMIAAADRLARMDRETGPRPSGAAVARPVALVPDVVGIHADRKQPHQQLSLSILDGRTRGTVLSAESREESHAARYRWRRGFGSCGLPLHRLLPQLRRRRSVPAATAGKFDSC